MERAKLPAEADNEMKSVLENIFANAFGNPIIFDTAPTNATMKANTWGVQGTDLYIKFSNNTTLKFSGIGV